MRKVFLSVLLSAILFQMINDDFCVSMADTGKTQTQTVSEKNSTEQSDETKAGESENKSDESEEERNERLASKSQYLINKGSYMEVVLDVEDGDNITVQLQAAFFLASTKATKEIPYRIVVPKGTYHLSSTVHIYSNTSLYLKGAVLRRDFQDGPMLMSGSLTGESPYIEQQENITIQGGTFDGNCFDSLYGAVTTSFSNLYFPYAKNVKIFDVTICNNIGGHHIQFTGTDYITIRDCTFKQYYTNKEDDEATKKEALKFGVLDIASSEGDVQKQVTCNHIRVNNNTFDDVYQGIGFEYAPSGKYYKNVCIYNNEFISCTKEAMILSSLVDADIFQNEFGTVQKSIWILSLNTKQEAGSWDIHIHDEKGSESVKIAPAIASPNSILNEW